VRKITGKRSGRPRRPMDWEYAFAQVNAIAAGGKASFFVVLPSELNAEYTDPTLMAARLVTSVRTSTVGVGAVAIGLIAWDDINDTPPIGLECPGPITNGNLDWVARQLHLRVNNAIGATSDSNDGFSYLSKARRRLGSSRSILAVIETIGVAADSIAVDARVLIKE